MGETVQMRKNGAKNGHTEVSKWMAASLAPERGKLTWWDAPAEELRDAIASATEDGAAVLLSKTSDGGALHIQIWSGVDRPKFYAPDMATLNALLELLTETAKTH